MVLPDGVRGKIFVAEQNRRDHGGNLDAAMRHFGGGRTDWLDLSTGINPQPYPLPELTPSAWGTLPDVAAGDALITAARRFWQVPQAAAVLAVPGASAAIAQIPRLVEPARVSIPGPTYNEHAASFAAAGWEIVEGAADAQVLVHPNNPDGRCWNAQDLAARLRVIDESFCDVMPDTSLIEESATPGTLILKSFGKFWGLAGLRLGFVIGDPALVSEMAERLGPWPVSGPALEIGRQALEDIDWAEATRIRLAADAARLEGLMSAAGAQVVGGCDLFRLFEVDDAKAWQTRLAQARIWSRVFPYNRHWLRLGMPGSDSWAQLELALE